MKFADVKVGRLFRFEGERIVYERTGEKEARAVGDFLGSPWSSPLNFFLEPLKPEVIRSDAPDVYEVDDPRRYKQ